MHVGLDTLVAVPMTIDIGGRPLRIAPLTIADLGHLQSWINSQLPDPIAIARRLAEGFPPEVQSELLREAYRDARHARKSAVLGSLEAESIIGTADGLAEVLALTLRKYQPEIDRVAVGKLMEAIQPGDVDRILSHAFGAEPTTSESADPKAMFAVASSNGP